MKINFVKPKYTTKHKKNVNTYKNVNNLCIDASVQDQNLMKIILRA